MTQPHRHHYGTPQHHDDGDENARAETLEQDVGQRFKEGVRHEENGKSRIVLPICEMEFRGQAVQFGIANICS